METQPPTTEHAIFKGDRSLASALPHLENRIMRLERELQQLRETTPRSDNVSLVIFSGELDKAISGLMIATTAASLGMNVTVFFTFWGINILKEKKIYEGKEIMEKMIDLMTPAGASQMRVSQMNMLGAGAAMLKRMMKDKDIISVEELLNVCKESGVNIMVCSMTMQVMGIKEQELMPEIEVAGAASFMYNASRSACTLFI